MDIVHDLLLLTGGASNKLDPATLNPSFLFEAYSTGRSIVTLDGSSNVSAVSDLSSHGNNAVQASSGNRPGYDGTVGLINFVPSFPLLSAWLNLSAQVQLTGDFTVIIMNNHGSGNNSVFLGTELSMGSSQALVSINGDADSPLVQNDAGTQATWSPITGIGSMPDIYSFRRAAAQGNHIYFRSTGFAETSSDAALTGTLSLNSIGVYTNVDADVFCDDNVRMLFAIKQSLTNAQITKIAKYYGFTLP